MEALAGATGCVEELDHSVKCISMKTSPCVNLTAVGLKEDLHILDSAHQDSQKTDVLGYAGGS